MDSVPLGTINDSYEDIQNAYDASQTDAPGCSVAINAAVTEDCRLEFLERNPWVAKYVAASGVWRGLLARGIEPLRVSGFGQGISETERDSLATLKYCIVWSEDAAYLGTSTLGRVIKVSPKTGRLLEAAQLGDTSAFDNVGSMVREQISAMECAICTPILPILSIGNTE